MSATLLLNDETLSGREVLNIVVLYDDRASRDHVLRIRDHLTEQFGSELEVVCSWWRFDFLADTTFGAAAADQVEKADVVLFAIHSATKLPGYVQSWAEKAFSKSRQGHCLLALLGGDDTDVEVHEIDDFLTTLAMRAGFDYLGASALGVMPSELARRSIAHRAFTRTSVMDDILSHTSRISRPRWGINE
jgi:hypothetical protein